MFVLALSQFLFLLVSSSSALKCDCNGDIGSDFCNSPRICPFNETLQQSCTEVDGMCYTEYYGGPHPETYSACCKKDLFQYLVYRIKGKVIAYAETMCQDRDDCSTRIIDTLRACENNKELVHPPYQMMLPGRTNLTCKCNSAGMLSTKGMITVEEEKGDPHWPFEPQEYDRFCVGDDREEKRCYFDDILPKLKLKNIAYFNERKPMCQYTSFKKANGDRFSGAACVFRTLSDLSREAVLGFNHITADKDNTLYCSEYSLCNDERYADKTGLQAEFNIQCPSVYMERLRQTIQWPTPPKIEPSLAPVTFPPDEYEGEDYVFDEAYDYPFWKGQLRGRGSTLIPMILCLPLSFLSCILK